MYMHTYIGGWASAQCGGGVIIVHGGVSVRRSAVEANEARPAPPLMIDT